MAPAHVPPVAPIENTLDPKHTRAHLHRSRLRGCSRSSCPCSSSKAALGSSRLRECERSRARSRECERSRALGGAQRCISTLETPPATPTTPPPPARMIVFGTAMRGGAQQWQHSQRINPSSSMQLRQQTCNGTQARRAYYECRRAPRRDEESGGTREAVGTRLFIQCSGTWTDTCSRRRGTSMRRSSIGSATSRCRHCWAS